MAAGNDVAKVGHDLDRCSSTVKSFTVQHHKDPRPVVFVDTPGFNHDIDTQRGDVEILRDIVFWLKNS